RVPFSLPLPSSPQGASVSTHLQSLGRERSDLLLSAPQGRRGRERWGRWRGCADGPGRRARSSSTCRRRVRHSGHLAVSAVAFAGSPVLALPPHLTLPLRPRGAERG